ncbi:unnamed protein product [Heligmosomoides polygyrus]|uniref:Reverse transcriptase domain-containing protein n=1 Tax=Heligmosomoides polygyrus TaxID=6339 RepID=A0A183FUN9_HELPZ|nr:unnamed protein product [Heligmosomoides polygyrus]
MRELEREDMGVKVDGRQLHHLRFAEDIVLITPSISHAERMLADFDRVCGNVGLQLNLTKTMFMRNGVSDVLKKEKIRLNKERAICLDVRALTRILRLAYDSCTEWTEFICATETIRRYKPIEDNCILPLYEKVLRQVKKELAKESKKGGPTKSGPIGFAAPEAALLARVATSFEMLRAALRDWTTFGISVVVYPLDDSTQQQVVKDVVDLFKKNLDKGGQLITAWTPISEEKEVQWRAMMELWATLDTTVEEFGGLDQVFTTANTREIEGRIYIEAGCPEAAGQFYFAYHGVAAAKYLFEMACPSLAVSSLKASRSKNKEDEDRTEFNPAPSAEVASALEQLLVDKKRRRS